MPEQVAPARRPGGRSARVRAAVLDAVLAEVTEHGYDGLTVDGVASRAGVHRTSVYRRWVDVGGLLADALNRAAEDDWSPPDTGSVREDLIELGREVGQLGHPGSVGAAVIAASFRSAEAGSALRAFWADRYVRCEVIVERAVARGELPAELDARRLLIAATAPLFHQLVLLGDALTDEQITAYAEDAVTAGRSGGFRS